MKRLSIIEQYRILHEKPYWFRGTTLGVYAEEIGACIRETGAKTLLDYGCGKAMLYKEREVHKEWGVELPYLYDPGVVGDRMVKSNKPPLGTKFDGVICTGVLEHLENPEEVIAELIGYAEKFLFLMVSVLHSPPKKKLPDGRGFHISVYPHQWWRDRVLAPHLRVELRFDAPE